MIRVEKSGQVMHVELASPPVNAFAHGVEIVEPSKDFSTAIKGYVDNDMKMIEQSARGRYGIKDTYVQMETYLALIKKWDELLETLT